MRVVDRILAISDIHGDNQRLQSLLKQAEYDQASDLLVICGDMVDRGTENLAVLKTCQTFQSQGAVLLKGNHEQFLEQSLIEMTGTSTWQSNPSEHLYNWVKYNGGATMYEEIKNLAPARLSELLTFIQSLSLYFSAGNFLFSHAGANNKKPIEENTEDDLVWMENQFPFCPAYQGKVLVFGHVPTWHLYRYDKKFKKANARIWFDQEYQDKIGIDCGGCFGGRLAALELPGYREFYV
ncbi:metallophosphoesterase [Sporomusa aerivorans]|uniref:metallophosphoesterase n=1 Tax=Sporomusa aerivorans TaxID=204936 RepID=UPI00352B65E4